MWQRRTCHWQGRNPHLRVQFDRDKNPFEEGVQQLQDANQGDEGLQQPSSLSPLRDTGLVHKIAPRFIARYLRLNLSKGAGL